MPKRYTTNQLFSYTIKQIHEALLKYNPNKIELANHLGIGDFITLRTHLGKFLFNGQPLTIYQLNQLSVHEASLQMGKFYDTLLPERQPNVARYAISYLYQVCSAANSIRSAAILLGIRDHTLHRHLSKIKYNDEKLTFYSFRSLSPNEISRCTYIDHRKSTDILPHERINLTPNIPENWLGNPISFVVDNDQLSEDNLNQLGSSDIILNEKQQRKRKLLIDPDFIYSKLTPALNNQTSTNDENEQSQKKRHPSNSRTKVSETNLSIFSHHDSSMQMKKVDSDFIDSKPSKPDNFSPFLNESDLNDTCDFFDNEFDLPFKM